MLESADQLQTEMGHDRRSEDKMDRDTPELRTGCEYVLQC